MAGGNLSVSLAPLDPSARFARRARFVAGDGTEDLQVMGVVAQYHHEGLRFGAARPRPVRMSARLRTERA